MWKNTICVCVCVCTPNMRKNTICVCVCVRVCVCVYACILQCASKPVTHITPTHILHDLPSKRNPNRIGMLWHDELRHVCERIRWWDTALGGGTTRAWLLYEGRDGGACLCMCDWEQHGEGPCIGTPLCFCLLWSRNTCMSTMVCCTVYEHNDLLYCVLPPTTTSPVPFSSPATAPPSYSAPAHAPSCGVACRVPPEAGCPWFAGL